MCPQSKSDPLPTPLAGNLASRLARPGKNSSTSDPVRPEEVAEDERRFQLIPGRVYRINLQYLPQEREGFVSCDQRSPPNAASPSIMGTAGSNLGALQPQDPLRSPHGADLVIPDGGRIEDTIVGIDGCGFPLMNA
jgi:hypothetical protein